MFDKAKAFNNALKMQRKIKKEREQIFHKEEKSDLEVLIRGDNKIESLIIDGEERKDVKDLLNTALKELEKKVEKKLQNSAGDVLSMLGVK